MTAAEGSHRRILFFTPAIPPDSYTAAARSGRFARFLPEFGYDVDVVTRGRPDQSSSSIWRAPREPRLRPAPFLSSLGYLLKRVLPHDDQLAWAGHAYRVGCRLLRRRRYDAILSTAPPFGAHLAALLLGHVDCIPCVCDFRDPLVGSPFREPEPLFQYDVPLERAICRHAAAIICNTDTVGAAWRARYPHASGRIHVIWNGFDPAENVEPGPLPSGRPKTIAHVGTLYGGRDPSALLSSLARLEAAGHLLPRSAVVRLAGPILPECLQRIAGALQDLQDRQLLQVDNRVLPPDEASRLGDSADAHLVIDINDAETCMQVPAKLFRCIRLGRPILALTYRGSPVERILARCGVPHRCVDPRLPSGIFDDLVRSFLDLPSDRTRPSDWFLSEFDGRRQAESLAAIFDSILASRPLSRRTAS